jgi:hypothetical protein
MGTAQATFAVERCGGAIGSHVTGSDVTGSDVSHVTGSDDSHVPVRKYAMRMRNRQLRNVMYCSECNPCCI